MDCSLPGSSVLGIFLARILEWVAISFSRGSSWPRDRTHVSCVFCIAGGFFTCWAIREALIIIISHNSVHGELGQGPVGLAYFCCPFSVASSFATICTRVASAGIIGLTDLAFSKAPPSMGFPRQEYWRGLPCPPSGDLPYSGIKSASPISSALQADSLPAEPSELEMVVSPGAGLSSARGEGPVWSAERHPPTQGCKCVPLYGWSNFADGIIEFEMGRGLGSKCHPLVRGREGVTVTLEPWRQRLEWCGYEPGNNGSF